MSDVVFDLKGNQLKEAKAYKLMLDMHGESKASEVINNITEMVEEQQKTIDKLNKDLIDCRSKSISIAAWVARETQGDDYTEKMQNRFYNNVIKKIKALAELKNKESV